MPSNLAIEISEKLINSQPKKPPYFVWAYFKRLASDLKKNCPDTNLGLCMYTILYENNYPLSRVFKSIGHKMLKCDSFTDKLMVDFGDEYFKPYEIIKDKIKQQ